MKQKTNFVGSRKAGKGIEIDLNTYKGKCETLAMYIEKQGVKCKYFTNALCGWLFDTSTLKKDANESKPAFETRKWQEAKQILASLNDNQLANTPLFALLSSANDMFTFCKDFASCYYTKDNKQVFAKSVKIALCADNMTSEEIAILDAKIEEAETITYNKFEMFVAGSEEAKTYYSKEEESVITRLLAETRNQRRKHFAETSDQPTCWFDSDNNICTLEASDKLTCDTLCNFLAFVMYKDVQKKREEAKQAAKEAKKQVSEAKQALASIETLNKQIEKLVDKVTKFKALAKIGEENKKALAKFIVNVCQIASNQEAKFAAFDNQQAESVCIAANTTLAKAKAEASKASKEFAKAKAEAEALTK